MPDKPWRQLIPTSDIQQYGRAFQDESRPIAAGTRPALVIVDMTRAFIDPRYPASLGSAGRSVLDANVSLVRQTRTIGIPVFYTKAFENPDYSPQPSEVGRWKILEADERSKDLPPGDVIVKELEPADGDIVIHKGMKPSAFFGTSLASQLIHAGVDSIIVSGVTTSGCVRATVLDAFQYNFHVLVPWECVGDRSITSHQVSLFDMHMKYADVASLSEIVAYLTMLPE